MKLVVNGRSDIVKELAIRFNSKSPSWKDILKYAESLLKINLKHKNIEIGSINYIKRKNTLYERAFRNIHLYCNSLGLESPFGYVYIISNPAWSELKIGSSVDAMTRLIQYNTYSPKRDFKLEHYILIPNYKLVEKELHKKYNADGEWVSTPINILKAEFKRLKNEIYRGIV